jgi:hypothetical protein
MTREDYLMAQAFVLAIEVLSTQPGAFRQDSNIREMKDCLDRLAVPCLGGLLAAPLGGTVRRAAHADCNATLASAGRTARLLNYRMGNHRFGSATAEPSRDSLAVVGAPRGGFGELSAPGPR